MSKINVSRAIAHIKGTNAFTPIVEAIVNAIQSIDEAGRGDGTVKVRILRSAQTEQEGPQAVSGVEIEDNGVGFTDEHFESFDTLYTDRKISHGAKGFGRMTYLKHFERVEIQSAFHQADGKMGLRTFRMGSLDSIVVDPKVRPTDQPSAGSTLRLIGAKREGKSLPRELDAIGQGIAERILPYLTRTNPPCPNIVLSEPDTPEEISLSALLREDGKDGIQSLSSQGGSFKIPTILGNEEFFVRLFKIYSSRGTSQVSLVAHLREVKETKLSTIVPEFEGEFQDPEHEGGRRFLVKAYVSSPFLDQHVDLERSGFRFDGEMGITAKDIVARAADHARKAMQDHVLPRSQEREHIVRKFVEEEAPWLKRELEDLNYSGWPIKPDPLDIEERLEIRKIQRTKGAKAKVEKILQGKEVPHEIARKAIEEISDSSKSELVHYVALRRVILDLLKKALEAGPNGDYKLEDELHSLIFPMRRDSDSTSYDQHNLWVLDERLSFTTYVASDMSLSGGSLLRPDIVALDRPVAFRANNEASSPVTIFEFKRPGRDDFTTRSLASDDPIQQVIRYLNTIREGGKYKTPQGREIQVTDETPCFGYLVCDIGPKVKRWLEKEKNFKPLPDGMGWHSYIDNNRLYFTVLSWDKLLKDAEMRNKVFFHKLSI